MTDAPLTIRILPMDFQEEFPDWSIEKLQHKFFLGELPFRPEGEYLYRKFGLKAGPGTVVLFQFRGFLVASAILNDVRHFKKPRVEVHDGERFEYNGALYFEQRSIRVFDPVGFDIVSKIWPKVTNFGHVKWSLDPKGYTAFKRELKHIKTATA